MTRLSPFSRIVPFLLADPCYPILAELADLKRPLAPWIAQLRIASIIIAAAIIMSGRGQAGRVSIQYLNSTINDLLLDHQAKIEARRANASEKPRSILKFQSMRQETPLVRLPSGVSFVKTELRKFLIIEKFWFWE
jgi:hypothetical protein